MAFFERTDERDKLVVCNICNCKCSERSLTGHLMKCSVRHKDKFDKELLARCPYDSGHIVKPADLNDHLEFCSKYQSKLVAEFQKEVRRADNKASGVRNPEEGVPSLPTIVDTGDDWNKLADENPFPNFQMRVPNLSKSKRN